MLLHEIITMATAAVKIQFFMESRVGERQTGFSLTHLMIRSLLQELEPLVILLAPDNDLFR
jgi:hypothetical protein